MIEVILSTGDRAEAETPADAVLAARTLMDDAASRSYYAGRGLTASFYVDGMLVRIARRHELREQTTPSDHELATCEHGYIRLTCIACRESNQ